MSDMSVEQPMTQSITQLIAQLSATDFNDRAIALAALVRHGLAASPALQTCLRDANVMLRTQAAHALAEIGDPASADVLAHGLGDADPRVRGRCAQGLAHLGDARALDALVQTLNDIPDELHYPRSVATIALCTYGQEAIAKVTPLLNSDDLLTRERAKLVVRQCMNSAKTTGSPTNEL
jgi:HEAT repeat protein